MEVCLCERERDGEGGWWCRRIVVVGQIEPLLRLICLMGLVCGGGMILCASQA